MEDQHHHHRDLARGMGDWSVLRVKLAVAVLCDEVQLAINILWGSPAQLATQVTVLKDRVQEKGDGGRGKRMMRETHTLPLHIIYLLRNGGSSPKPWEPGR